MSVKREQSGVFAQDDTPDNVLLNEIDFQLINEEFYRLSGLDPRDPDWNKKYFRLMRSLQRVIYLKKKLTQKNSNRTWIIN